MALPASTQRSARSEAPQTRAALDVPFRMGVAAKLAEFPDVAAAENEFWQSFRHGFELSSSRTWRESSPGADLGGAGVGVPVRR